MARYKNPIRNCAVEFRKICPLQWENLWQTADPTVRHCDTCKRDVHFCENDSEAIAHAQAGHCIAKPQLHESELPTIYVGEPKITALPIPSEKAAMREDYNREAAKTHELRNLKYSTRFCPSCGYPCPDWRQVCRVCDFEIGSPTKDNQLPSEQSGGSKET